MRPPRHVKFTRVNPHGSGTTPVHRGVCPTYREHVFLYVSVKMMEVSKLIKSVDEQL